MKKFIFGLLFMLSALGFCREAFSSDLVRTTSSFIYRHRRKIAGVVIVAAIWWLNSGDDDNIEDDRSVEEDKVRISPRNTYTERSATCEEESERRIRLKRKELEQNRKTMNLQLAVNAHRATSPTKKFQRVTMSSSAGHSSPVVSFIPIAEEDEG